MYVSFDAEILQVTPKAILLRRPGSKLKGWFPKSTIDRQSVHEKGEKGKFRVRMWVAKQNEFIGAKARAQQVLPL